MLIGAADCVTVAVMEYPLIRDGYVCRNVCEALIGWDFG